MDGYLLTRTALRVLNAWVEHRVPEAADIEFLTKHALLSEVGLPVDELASEIIQRELVRRKAATFGN